MAHSSHSSRRVSRGTCRSCSCNWRRRMRMRMRIRTRIKQFRFCLAAAVNVTGFGTPAPSPMPPFLWPVPPVCACKLANMCISYISVYTCIHLDICMYVCLSACMGIMYLDAFLFLLMKCASSCRNWQSLNNEHKKNVPHAFLFLFQYPVNVDIALKGYSKPGTVERSWDMPTICARTLNQSLFVHRFVPNSTIIATIVEI